MPTPELLARVAEILRAENVTEASGEWSVFDVARQLDPNAHKPASMFDTCPPYPSADHFLQAKDAIAELCPEGGRYVGGVSQYLYSLPTKED